MRLIINAMNVHQGGGRTLLYALVSAINQPAILILDSRFEPLPHLNEYIDVIRVPPKLISRLKAEVNLKRLSTSEDIVLCFGNLPPLFKISSKVFVYLQNRYLCSAIPLQGFSLKIRLRIIFERMWLRVLLRKSSLIVQSESMKRSLKSSLGISAHVMPFIQPTPSPFTKSAEKNDFDYVYVASGEPHKNHKLLLEAWIILAEHGLKPSLLLTLDSQRDRTVVENIERKIHSFDLRVTINSVAMNSISDLYTRSGALIYPSLVESFGLPLLEADRYGLTIIASERDYVRDVVTPFTTFDPESAISIARAVMRHMHIETGVKMTDNPQDFLEKLQLIA